MIRISALSISRPVQEQLHRLRNGQSDAHVLAVFERACHLVTGDGDVIALVLPQIGDGPLNVVVDGAAGSFARIEPGASVTVDGTQLNVVKLRVGLEQATVWEPVPDWHTLRGQRAEMASRLPFLRTLCLRHAPADSFLMLLEDFSPSDAFAAFPAAREAAETWYKGWPNDVEQIREGAVRLAGLGGGLTPAGDDFLTGAMLWTWVAHSTPVSFCRILVEAAAPRTTALSAAFLRAAARGECSAPWHVLLTALGDGDEAKITMAAREILACGATSGADSLAGFLHLVLWRR
jgi:hypothetical protein